MFYFAFIASFNSPNQDTLFLDEMDFYADDLRKYLSVMGFSKENINGVMVHLSVT